MAEGQPRVPALDVRRSGEGTRPVVNLQDGLIRVVEGAAMTTDDGKLEPEYDELLARMKAVEAYLLDQDAEAHE
jgi:hypothetical protein